MSQSQIPDPLIRDQKAFAKVNRRELLKVAPLLVAATLVIPKVRGAALSNGLKFSDWISAKWFRKGHTVRSYSDAELTPLERFPLNTYDADDPGVDLEAWRLQVSGLVERSGEYRLSDLQTLPKASTPNKHDCSNYVIGPEPPRAWNWLDSERVFPTNRVVGKRQTTTSTPI